MITKIEWNRHRDNMYGSLKALLQRKKNDYVSYKYTCEIMALTFGYIVDDFMRILETKDIFVLAEELTIEEYGQCRDNKQ